MGLLNKVIFATATMTAAKIADKVDFNKVKAQFDSVQGQAKGFLSAPLYNLSLHYFAGCADMYKASLVLGWVNDRLNLNDAQRITLFKCVRDAASKQDMGDALDMANPILALPNEPLFKEMERLLAPIEDKDLAIYLDRENVDRAYPPAYSVFLVDANRGAFSTFDALFAATMTEKAPFKNIDPKIDLITLCKATTDDIALLANIAEKDLQALQAIQMNEAEPIGKRNMAEQVSDVCCERLSLAVAGRFELKPKIMERLLPYRDPIKTIMQTHVSAYVDSSNPAYVMQVLEALTGFAGKLSNGGMVYIDTLSDDDNAIAAFYTLGEGEAHLVATRDGKKVDTLPLSLVEGDAPSKNIALQKKMAAFIRRAQQKVSSTDNLPDAMKAILQEMEAQVLLSDLTRPQNKRPASTQIKEPK